jgi:predicted DNA-binding transcriptional regulator AlpA
MSETDKAERRAQVLRRPQSGEKVGAVAAACGVSNSTVYRWRRENSSTATKSAPARRSLSKRSAALPPAPLPSESTTRDAQDLANNQVAQLYGGYVLPGSQLDTQGGVGLMVSRWDTATGWPYRTMQFKVTLTDTTATSNGAKPATKPGRAARPRVTRQPRRKDPRAGRSKR